MNCWHLRNKILRWRSKPTFRRLKKINSWCDFLWSLESNTPNPIQSREYSMGGVMEGESHEVSRSSTRIAMTGSGMSMSTGLATTMCGMMTTAFSSETTNFPQRIFVPRGFSFPNILSNQKAFFRHLPV